MKSGAFGWWRLVALPGIFIAGGCSDSPSSANPVPAVPPTEYRLSLRTSTQDLGAVVLAFDGAKIVERLSADPTIRGVLSQENGKWRAIFWGPVDGKDLVRVEPSIAGQPPMVTVLDASTGSARGFRQLLPAEVAIAVAPRMPSR